MSKIKTTDWFDGAKFIPAHVGVYEVVHTPKSTRFQYWNGDFFGMPSSNKSAAYWGRDVKSEHQHVQWREVQS